jgi:hypothetical protein
MEAGMTDPLELLAATVDRGAVEREIRQLDREIQERALRMNKLRTLLSLFPGDQQTAVDKGTSVATAETTGSGSVSANVRPSLADAVLLVMQEAPDDTWTGNKVLTSLGHKGWAPGGKTPRNSVDATLSRLRKAGKVTWHGPGMYKLPSESDGDSAAGNSAATLLDGLGEV